jgi:hypothetical protein
MRLLRKLSQVTALLLCTIVGLSLLRIARTPALAGPEGGPAAARNGDVNCDGQLDISDSISILNWLFSDGSEPCAIAQPDTCCEDVREEVAALRSTVDTLLGRVPGAQDIVNHSGLIPGGPGGDTRPVFTVPGDRWLVMTSLTYPMNYNVAFYQVINGESTELALDQTHTSGGHRTFGWSTGLPLPPGTEITVFPNTEAVLPYRINGYYLANEPQ